MTPAITDDMLDRHAARGTMVADQYRRSGLENERPAVDMVLKQSAAMAKSDGITDKALVGFLGMGAIGHFFLRLMDTAGGSR
jgi:hypothetical protein